MTSKPNPFSVVSTDNESDAPKRREFGHYFDQIIFDLHYSLQAARARRLALEDDLAKRGVLVDPVTGEVSFAPVKSGKGAG